MSCVASIHTSPGGKLAGSGAVVGPDLVLTCAHVVNEALGRNAEERSRPPEGKELQVRFAAAPGAVFRANVDAGADGWSHPPADRAQGADLCLLKLKERIPEAVSIALLSPVQFEKELDVRAIGYPSDWNARTATPQLDAALARVLAVDGYLWLLRADHAAWSAAIATRRRSAGLVHHGFSGAPVQLGDTVVGLITQARDVTQATAYAIPARFFPSRILPPIEPRASGRSVLPEANREADTPHDDTAHVQPENPAAISRVHNILPANYEILYGRQNELEDLDRLLLSERTAYTGVVITAIGGMGKTALAREFCLGRQIWKTHDVILGMQSRKRQIRVAANSAQTRALRFDDQGQELNVRELIVELGVQLGIASPGTKTESDLKKDIVAALEGRRALVILDNLETAVDTSEVLQLLGRLCSSPLQKALVTTRYFPEDHPGTFYPLYLNAIQDAATCRALVSGLLRRSGTRGTAPDEAISAIIDIARGHPLCLELLAGKLASQGPSAIIDLQNRWTDAADLSNDYFVSNLCRYVFDNRFMELIGELGVILLRAIAMNNSGQDENILREATGLPDDDLEETLAKLFQVNCIYREFDGDLATLTMHPLTRTHFRTVLV